MLLLSSSNCLTGDLLTIVLSSLYPEELMTLVLKMSFFWYRDVNEKSLAFLVNLCTYRLLTASCLLSHLVLTTLGIACLSLAIWLSYFLLNSRFVVFSKNLWSSKTLLNLTLFLSSYEIWSSFWTSYGSMVESFLWSISSILPFLSVEPYES